MLSANGTFDTWSFGVADDVPPNWQLESSSDGGLSWNFVFEELYGNDISDGPNSGFWYRATRDDAGDNPYGPYSNIIVVP